MGSSKAGGKTQVVEYYMSTWWAFATGPVDKILSIIVNEKEAWKGSVAQSAVIPIIQPDLYGGLDSEGGAVGNVVYLDGKSTQTIPDYLAQKLGLTSATCPAHRGIASVFMTGGVPNQSSIKEADYTPVDSIANENPAAFPIQLESTYAGGLQTAFTGMPIGNETGFYWRANAPAVPPIKIKAQRRPRGLPVETAMIGDDANVVHIIYEVMTNSDWGMGNSTGAINVTSFTAAAQTVFDEGIGISILWREQQYGEEFIAKMLEYIDGVIFTNPRDGLLTIKLIRGDYDASTLFNINPSNATLNNYERKMWGETINEIVVTWTNPENEEEETVSIQDLGNISMQGSIVSDSRDFKGVRNSNLAMRLGARDLRVASSPLLTCRATVNRSAWDIVPGSVVKVTWPEHGMVDVIMRVMEPDYGKSSDSKIKVRLVEDIYAIDAGDYYAPPGSSWVNQKIDPKPLDHSLVITLPNYILARKLPTGATATASLVYPEVLLSVLGGDPASDISQYRIAHEQATPGGTTEWVGDKRMRSLLSYSTLGVALQFSTSTSLMMPNTPTAGAGVRSESLALIGGADNEQELCLITEVSDVGVTVRRGLLDTVPRAWPSGTPVWFIPRDVDIIDETKRVADQPVTYRLLSVTSKGRLRIAAAPDLDYVATARPWMPFRPANCKVNGFAEGPVNAVGATTLALTWSNRNRTVEDSVLLSWNAGSVTPEVGQTTTITLLAANGTTVIHQIDGITGSTYSLATSLFGTASTAYVKFTSKIARTSGGTTDILESLQGHMIQVTLT